MNNEYTERVVARAERDENYRSQLLSDPGKAIADEFGIEVPDTVKIRVLEEGADEVVLVLPSKTGPGALREDELATAAGGYTNDGGSGAWTCRACRG